MPPRLSLELVALAVIIGLGAWNARLRQAINARPAVEDKVQIVRVQGPSRVVVRYKDGQIVERERIVESVRYEKMAEHNEVPACPAPKRLYGGLGIDSLDAWQKPYLRGGGIVAESFGVGGTLNPWAKRVGLEVAYHW